MDFVFAGYVLSIIFFLGFGPTGIDLVDFYSYFLEQLKIVGSPNLRKSSFAKKG